MKQVKVVMGTRQKDGVCSLTEPCRNSTGWKRIQALGKKHSISIRLWAWAYWKQLFLNRKDPLMVALCSKAAKMIRKGGSGNNRIVTSNGNPLKQPNSANIMMYISALRLHIHTHKHTYHTHTHTHTYTHAHPTQWYPMQGGLFTPSTVSTQCGREKVGCPCC